MRCTINVTLTEAQRRSLNIEIDRLDTNFNAYLTAALQEQMGDMDKLATLRARVIAERKMPRVLRDSYRSSKSASVRRVMANHVEDLALALDVTVGAVCRAALLQAMDAKPPIYIEPDKLILKAKFLTDTIRNENRQLALDLASRHDAWLARGGTPESWVATLEELARWIDRPLGSVLVWLHGEGVDAMRAKMIGDANV